MTLYEIDSALTDLVDVETGEVLDIEEFEALEMERNQKIEGMALWIKNLKAEAEAIKNEEQALATRRRADENKVERLKNYIAFIMHGESLKTPRVAISYRNTPVVKVDDEAGFVDWARQNGEQYLRYKEPEINKTALKKALDSGENVPGAHIETSVSTIIK